jgi:hypothetical protein
MPRSTAQRVSLVGLGLLWVPVLHGQQPPADLNAVLPAMHGHFEADPYMSNDPKHWDSTLQGPISWQYPTNTWLFNPLVPHISMTPLPSRRPRDGEYLGFISGEGTYVEDLSDGAIYVYNNQTHTLTKKYERFEAMPESVFAAMHNSLVDYMLPGYRHDYPAPTHAYEATTAPDPDPNMAPAFAAPRYPMPISWYYDMVPGRPTVPQVRFHGVLAPASALSVVQGTNRYLGFNQEGSWVVSAYSHHVYVWNGTTLTLVTRYHNLADVPRALLLTLRNAEVEDLLPHAPPAPPPKAVAPAPSEPSTEGQAAIFGDPAAVRSALGQLRTGGAATATAAGAHSNAGTVNDSMRGTGASVTGGVLTFTRNDGSKGTFAVVRPKVGSGTFSGTAGSWLAVDQPLMFNVQGNGTVTGQTIPASTYQILRP